MRNKIKDSKIDISIVIPAYNEEKLLPMCLEALKNQNFLGTYEIIVVDNNSSDNTMSVIKKYQVKSIKEARKGVSFARQAGFLAARGAIIASTDADTIVPKNWLSKIYDSFQKYPQIVGVTGGFDLYGETNKRLLIFNILSPLLRLLTWIFSGQSHLWGANFAIRREVFQKIGGFDTRLATGEDCDLGSHAKEFGKIIYVRNLTVATSARRFEKSLHGKHIKYVFNLYFLNFWWLLFFKKPRINQLSSVRTEGRPHFLESRHLQKARFVTVFAILFLAIFFILIQGVISPKSQLFGKSYWHKPTHSKVVALTFDDGPNEPYTSEILDVLAKNDIKATFFMIGENVKYYPEVAKKVADEGNIVANHSYSHKRDLPIEDKKTMIREINSTQDLIFQIIGEKPHLFRSPHGYKSPMLASELKKENLAVVEWSDMTDDYDKPGEKSITKKILAKVRPGGIIVIHDGDKTQHGSDRSQSVKALEEIIQALKKKGYSFVTVPELLNIPAYN